MPPVNSSNNAPHIHHSNDDDLKPQHQSKSIQPYIHQAVNKIATPFLNQVNPDQFTTQHSPISQSAACLSQALSANPTYFSQDCSNTDHRSTMTDRETADPKKRGFEPEMAFNMENEDFQQGTAFLPETDFEEMNFEEMDFEPPLKKPKTEIEASSQEATKLITDLQEKLLHYEIVIPEDTQNNQLFQHLHWLKLNNGKVIKFTLNNCSFISQLPENLPNMISVLSLIGCDHLETLPKKFPNQLLRLNILLCTKLSTIPFGSLPKNLKELNLSYCPSLNWTILDTFNSAFLSESTIETLNLEGTEVSDIDSFNQHIQEGAIVPLQHFSAPSNITDQQLASFLDACTKNRSIDLKSLNLTMCLQITEFPSSFPKSLKTVSTTTNQAIKNFPEQFS